MIGTEKQVAYAQDLISNARAWHTGHSPSGKIHMEQVRALDVIELVTLGNLAAAEDALQTAALWVQECIKEVAGQPKIDAHAVIEALRNTPRAI